MSAPTYILFAGENYYPRGGARDFRKISGSLEELEAFFSDNLEAWIKDSMTHDGSDWWAHMADASTMEIVAEATYHHGYKVHEWDKTNKTK